MSEFLAQEFVGIIYENGKRILFDDVNNPADTKGCSAWRSYEYDYASHARGCSIDGQGHFRRLKEIAERHGGKRI